MDAKMGMKGQSATEFMATYAWAFLLIALVIAALYYLIYIPSNSVPQRCFFESGISCLGISVGTNTAVGTVVNLYAVNGQQYDLIGNTIATAVIPNSGTANAICTPANVFQGGVILCKISMPSSVNVGQSVTGTLFVNSSACLSGTVSNCQAIQPVSYRGNFTTTVSGSTKSTPVTISLIDSATQVSPNSQNTIKLNAHVNIFGEPSRGASVVFNIVSSTASGTANTISPQYALTDATGNASVTLITTTASGAGTITVNAVFAGVASSNTIVVT